MHLLKKVPSPPLWIVNARVTDGKIIIFQLLNTSTQKGKKLASKQHGKEQHQQQHIQNAALKYHLIPVKIGLNTL